MRDTDTERNIHTERYSVSHSVTHRDTHRHTHTLRDIHIQKRAPTHTLRERETSTLRENTHWGDTHSERLNHFKRVTNTETHTETHRNTTDKHTCQESPHIQREKTPTLNHTHTHTENRTHSH